MLSIIEFIDKKHLILDKEKFTVIMSRRSGTNIWTVVEIPRDRIRDWTYHTYDNDQDAYDYYRERMESYGFKPFPIIVE